jgi:hypothetical protein
VSRWGAVASLLCDPKLLDRLLDSFVAAQRRPEFAMSDRSPRLHPGPLYPLDDEIYVVPIRSPWAPDIAARAQRSADCREGLLGMQQHVPSGESERLARP